MWKTDTITILIVDKCKSVICGENCLGNILSGQFKKEIFLGIFLVS